MTRLETRGRRAIVWRHSSSFQHFSPVSSQTYRYNKLYFVIRKIPGSEIPPQDLAKISDLNCANSSDHQEREEGHGGEVSMHGGVASGPETSRNSLSIPPPRRNLSLDETRLCTCTQRINMSSAFMILPESEVRELTKTLILCEKLVDATCQLRRSHLFQVF